MFELIIPVPLPLVESYSRLTVHARGVAAITLRGNLATPSFKKG
jgi:hypothetical protein